VNPSRPRVSRRDLINLRRASRALGDAPTSQPTGEQDLLKASRPAMGSYFEVRVGAATPGAAELGGRALDLIDELEARLTVYRDDSEISRLNATAHLGPVELRPDVFGLIERGLEISGRTGGAYDLTTGALSIAWGFFKGPKRIPSEDELADARGRTGYQHVRLEPSNQAVSFDRPGVTINLGSIGKGFAIDRAVELIRAHWWPTSALVHGGRSSLFALGSPPGRFGDRWKVALRNPFRADRPLGILNLRNRGMGTSGTDFQRFESGGRVFGHILDPRTGRPAFGPASVTALAPTAAEADALSTAFYLLGLEASADYVRSHPGVAAVFVEEGRSDGSPRTTLLGLDPPDFDPDV